MIDAQGLEDLSNAIQAQGYDAETSGHLAARIGDTPEMDNDGNLVVHDSSGKLLATIDIQKLRDYNAAARRSRNETRPDGSV